MIFIGGVIVGILISLVAIVAGKRCETYINSKYEATSGVGKIIKKKTDIEEFLHDN